MHNKQLNYQAILVVSFGGPEAPADVIPFLENVLRGRNVPHERLLQVAEHYYHFGGKSPINDHCRALVAALRAELPLPVYWGNRNWHPMLTDTVRQMAADGVERALAIATSAYPSYSGCRQYLENIEKARAEVGPNAPIIDKLPPFSNHPLYLEATADRVRAALDQVPEDRRAAARLVYTAQSRSGPPSQPWLEPDILDHLRRLAENGVRDVVAAPIGFLSDHMEVMYDLDVEAAALARELDLHFVRAQTVGTHPLVIRMFGDLVRERLAAPAPVLCAPDCCPPRRAPG
jgi:ferrochelatase